MRMLKNTTVSPIAVSDTGVTIDNVIDYEIPPQDYPLWAASGDILPLIASGDIVVSDGMLDLNARAGTALVRGNFVILTEYYTLTDESGVLVGNGTILNLNEEVV